jgi:hypothetical protein
MVDEVVRRRVDRSTRLLVDDAGRPGGWSRNFFDDFRAGA